MSKADESVHPPSDIKPADIPKWNIGLVKKCKGDRQTLQRGLLCGPCKGSKTARDMTILVTRIRDAVKGDRMFYYCGVCNGAILLLDAKGKLVQACKETQHAAPPQTDEGEDD